MAEVAGAGPTLVLASASPRRADLLRRLGLDFVVRPTDVDETHRPGESAAELVGRLARSKARAGAAMGGGEGGDTEVVLAADTVVVLRGRVLGKPTDHDAAAAILRSLSGTTHEVVTGLSVLGAGDAWQAVVTTHVTFRALTDREISWYVATGEPHDKAGAYGLQGAGAALVARVDGSDTNVVGLPLATCVQLLRCAGIDPLAPAGTSCQTR